VRPRSSTAYVLTVPDVVSALRFFTDELGTAAVRNGEPSIVRLGSSWVVIDRDDHATSAVLVMPDDVTDAADVDDCYQLSRELGWGNDDATERRFVRTMSGYLIQAPRR